MAISLRAFPLRERTMKRRILLLVIVATAFVFGVPRGARAARKPDGQRSSTNVSCCSDDCKMPTIQRGKKVFGFCCTPTTCSAQGANCGTIPDGDCGDTLPCGTCPKQQSCGGGGTPHVCG